MQSKVENSANGLVQSLFDRNKETKATLFSTSRNLRLLCKCRGSFTLMASVHCIHRSEFNRYHLSISTIRDRCDVLVIPDEVMCSTFRLCHLFACIEDGVAPNRMTFANGRGAAHQPIGEPLTFGAISHAIAAGSRPFQHLHTYVAHAMAAVGGKAVLCPIHERGLLARALEMGEVSNDAQLDFSGKHSHIADYILLVQPSIIIGSQVGELTNTLAPAAHRALVE